MTKIKIISADGPSTFEEALNEFMNTHTVTGVSTQVIVLDNKPCYTATITYYVSPEEGVLS